MHEVCIHRGTALSLGHVEGCEIVCAYMDGGSMKPARVLASLRWRIRRDSRQSAHRLIFLSGALWNCLGFSERTSEAATGDSRARLT